MLIAKGYKIRALAKGPARGEGQDELVDFVPAPFTACEVVGRRVDEVLPHIGTYGMGGPGFFGFRIQTEWLVIAVWGAGEWMTAQGRSIEDFHYHEDRRDRPWLAYSSDGKYIDDLSGQIVGRMIENCDVQKHSLQIAFAGRFQVEIDEDPSMRPPFASNGLPRRFEEDDDLRKAVFLSPTAEIWI